MLEAFEWSEIAMLSGGKKEGGQMLRMLTVTVIMTLLASWSCQADDDELQLCVNRCGFENNGKVGSKPYDKCIFKCPGAKELMTKERRRNQNESRQGLSSKADAVQDYCGIIRSLPDSFVMKGKGPAIIFSGDNSMPPDPKNIYSYLNAHGSDNDRVCYCVTGRVKIERVGARMSSSFTEVRGLKTCEGKVLR